MSSIVNVDGQPIYVDDDLYPDAETAANAMSWNLEELIGALVMGFHEFEGCSIRYEDPSVEVERTMDDW